MYKNVQKPVVFKGMIRVRLLSFEDAPNQFCRIQRCSSSKLIESNVLLVLQTDIIQQFVCCWEMIFWEMLSTNILHLTVLSRIWRSANLPFFLSSDHWKINWKTMILHLSELWWGDSTKWNVCCLTWTASFWTLRTSTQRWIYGVVLHGELLMIITVTIAMMIVMTLLRIWRSLWHRW